MEPLAVDLSTLVRALDSELRLAPGRVLMARVIEPPNENGRGTLSLAGMALEASLPENVEHGQPLRLTVREVNPERVVLTLGADQPAALMPSVVPLPGGASVWVAEDDDHTSTGAGKKNSSVSLHFDAPTLGRIDLRLELGDGNLRAAVAVSSAALEQAGGNAKQLQTALVEAVKLPTEVSVTARHDPLDIYA